ncbi:MAG: hypothetical protein DRO88_09435 [Promethearchaeia archaeon]|nr:MAG: hypothetical protein DRO88_09435 [Candidatus Lokiarchaeia archaeon]
MGEKCPACGKAELEELVPGVKSCPVCRKIFRSKIEKEKPMEKEGEILEGEYFMKNTNLNPKYEIADKGITIFREKNKIWFAVLLCHTPDFPSVKYIRLSWWKKSINTHAGMFKIDNNEELENILISLQRIEDDFDDYFEVKGKKTISFNPIPERENIEDTSYIFDLKKRLCPKCNYKMKKSKNHRYYECEKCGEIIILDDGHPIYDIPAKYLPLSYSTNFPINFYIPNYGITIRNTMGDWKAIVIIHAKENPDKKWLRFYWWRRDFQHYMMSQYAFGSSQGLKWETKKGVMSPNIYDKTLIRPLIEGLNKIKNIW